MSHLFAYGTLMCQDIMRDVSGYRLSGVPGMLKEYMRRTVKGEVYPAIIQKTGSTVEGILYRDISNQAWMRLDRFEGDLYSRESVCVELTDGETLVAFTYVLQPKFLNRLGPSKWDYTGFLQNDKTEFLRVHLKN